MNSHRLLTAALALLFAAPLASGQTNANLFQAGEGAPVQIFPNARPNRGPVSHINPAALHAVRLLRVDSVAVKTHIDGQKAVTALEYVVSNPSSRGQESQILIPVPIGASLQTFELDGAEGKLTGKLLPKEEARQIYDSIVRKVQDPGLLEFAAEGLLRSSVFPVPPNGKATVQVTYEQWLPMDGNRVDYILPRSEALEYEVPWSFTLTWKSQHGVEGVFCPSHELETKLSTDGVRSLESRGKLQPGAIRVSALLREANPQNLTATVYTYPEEKGEDGYFLLVLQAPTNPRSEPVPRELTFVFDRSGSMAGEKIEQTRAAAMQVLETLNPIDTFNFITYNEGVRSLFPSPSAASEENLQTARQFIRSTRVSGGTNIHAALQEALKQQAPGERFPAILFLTDGIPTIGEVREKAIRDSVTGNRRIFSFGVGLDLNAPLLSSLAENTGGKESFVLPGQNVELPVAGLAKRLQGVLAVNPQIEFQQPGRIDDVLPQRLPDLFAGDQVLVLGRYRGVETLTFRLQTSATSGASKAWTIDGNIEPSKSSYQHAFVPRLWASRKIAALTSALRDLGAETSTLPSDPRTNELVKEIVRLSVAHGILTEYTAFLAVEGAPASAAAPANVSSARQVLEERGLKSREGAGSINQLMNNSKQRDSAVVKKDNSRLDANLREVKEHRVQQIADKAFTLRGGVWEESKVEKTDAAQDVFVGTPEFDALVDRLVATNRQSILGLPGDILLQEGPQLLRIRRAN